MQQFSDEAVLMMMEMTARAERDIGSEGWGRPPDELRDACDRLVAAGLAERKGDWFRPTAEGTRSLTDKIWKVQ